MEDKVKLTIDGVEMEVPKSYTILDAAREHGIDIPTLCHLKGINEIGACRMCIVEVEGARGFATSCVMPVSEGMVVRTNTPAVRDARKFNYFNKTSYYSSKKIKYHRYRI